MTRNYIISGALCFSGGAMIPISILVGIGLIVAGAAFIWGRA